MREANKLSAKAADNAKPQDKPYKLADGEGLYLYITPAGGKLWRMKYYKPATGEGKKQEGLLSFGAYPAVSLKQAREMKLEARKLLALGLDPAFEKKRLKIEADAAQLKASLTFEVVAREWFRKRTPDKTERYKYLLKNRLENQLLPALGAIPIADMEPQSILAVLHEVEERGAIEQAKRLGRIVKQVCSYAVACGYTKYNAASEIMAALSSAGEVTHRAAITKPDEVGKLLRALDEYQGDMSISYALRILPYVFVRSQEIRGTRWDEIDLASGTWTIPAERMKKKVSHTVPLARQVVKLFLELRAWSGSSALCFPSPWAQGRCISDMGLLQAIRRLGYNKEEMCIHGFRGMASTLLNEQGYRPDVIEAQLAHVEKNAVRRAYNHAEYLPERRAMMQAWADYLVHLKSI